MSQVYREFSHSESHHFSKTHSCKKFLVNESIMTKSKSTKRFCECSQCSSRKIHSRNMRNKRKPKKILKDAVDRFDYRISDE